MTVWTDIGMVKEFIITPKPETKEHYSTRAGTKEVDLVAIISKKMEFSAKLDEWTGLNLGELALMGIEATDGSYEILGASKIEKQLKFEGANDYGARVQLIFPRAFFMCSDAIGLIGIDDFQSLPISGQILRADVVSGSFGTMAFLGGATGNAPVDMPSTLNYAIPEGVLSVADLA